MSGGTVTYHRVEYLGDVSYPWEVWFDGGQGPIFFTAEQGEAMGLTPPEPEPLPVTIRRGDTAMEIPWDHLPSGAALRAGASAIRPVLPGHAQDIDVLSRVMDGLRDARQDPQPASDPDSEPWPWDDEGFMCPKMLRETMCVAQSAVGRQGSDPDRHIEHSRRIQQVIDWCDRHRPLASTGKHRHATCTPTCGCEDKREPITLVRRTVDSFTILDPKPAPPVATVEIGGQVMTQAQYDAARFPLLHPESPSVQDDTPGIDFDALPDGTVLLRTDGRPGVRIKVDGVWTFDGHGIAAPLLRKNWKVHQPAPLSPGECLRGLLAGRDDADELVEYAAKHWVSNKPEIMHSQYVLTGAIGDAARGGA